MSKHESHKNQNFARVVSAGEYWRDRCLIGDGSLFTDKKIWSKANLEDDFEQRFVDFVVPSDDPKYKTNTVEQWKIFLAETNSPPEIYQLMAEFLWVCYRIPLGAKPGTKRKKIQEIWEQSGESFPEHEYLQDENLTGIANLGQIFANRLWLELVILAFFVREIKLLDTDTRTRLLTGNNGKELSLLWDAWPQQWYKRWPRQWENYFTNAKRKLKVESCQIRSIAMYLLFPDYIESIYSNRHKIKIVKAFSGEDMSGRSLTEIDEAIYAIRRKLEKEHGPFHFYEKHILDLWNDAEKSRKGKVKQGPISANPSSASLRPTGVLNQIFYGPPGTGKTYHTANEAVKIIDSEFYENNKNDRDAIKKKFDELKESGQIEFVTFHQSFGYEEFVEGIRPVMDGTEGDVSYEISDGVFKNISDKAASDKPSLPFEEAIERLKDECSENRIAMRTVAYKKEHEVWYVEGNKSFMTKAMEGISPNPNPVHVSIKKIRQYYDDPERKKGTRPRMIFNYLKENYGLDASQQIRQKQNYVLIIDEINRGNVSRIFGELITLIEESKRKGKSEATTVRLPYSGDDFGIPNNLYIIGTMNTADRSIALLDTALRRRFRFIEMMPNYDLLEGVEVDGIQIDKLLKAMNDRIEALYDRDHQIGHSYFLRLKESPKMDTLKDIFQHEILPLLQEYFYEDWEKINLVLNNNGFLNNNRESIIDSDKKLWDIAAEKFSSAGNYLKIYKSVVENGGE